jgi:hypothetical protein
MRQCIGMRTHAYAGSGAAAEGCEQSAKMPEVFSVHQRAYGVEHDRMQAFIVVDVFVAVADVDFLKTALETGTRLQPAMAERRENIRAVKPDCTLNIRA